MLTGTHLDLSLRIVFTVGTSLFGVLFTCFWRILDGLAGVLGTVYQFLLYIYKYKCMCGNTGASADQLGHHGRETILSEASCGKMFAKIPRPKSHVGQQIFARVERQESSWMNSWKVYQMCWRKGICFITHTDKTSARQPMVFSQGLRESTFWQVLARKDDWDGNTQTEVYLCLQALIW